MTPLINTQIVQSAIALYLEFGGKQQEIDIFGLSSEQLGKKSAFFPSKPFLLFMNYVMQRLPPKDVYAFLSKLVTKVSIPDTFGYLDPPPATVEEGLNQMIAVSRKIMPHSTIRLEKSITKALIKREKQIHNVKDETAAELYTLAFILNLITTLSGTKCIPSRVGLISPKSTRLEQIFNDWGECDISYETGSTSITLPLDQLSLPVVCHPNSFGESKDNVTSYSFVDSIKFSMDSYVGQPSYNIDTIADNHGVSARTLQNQLIQHGVSYQELKDQVLMENVNYMFKQVDLNLTHIAHSLGYASLSQFSRSIKRLTGLSPSAYRKNLMQ